MIGVFEYANVYINENITIKKINNADTKELVDETLNEALSEIDQVKTKSCSSNTIVIYSNLLSLMIVVFVLFKLWYVFVELLLLFAAAGCFCLFIFLRLIAFV